MNLSPETTPSLRPIADDGLKFRRRERKVRNRTFHFRAFGINIASDIFLPELETSEGIPDVRIVSGKTPREIPKALVKADYYQAAPNQFILHVPQAGRYYVADGKRIVVEPEHSADSGMIRLFLLGTAFGALLQQRGILPIHGSAVVINGQAIIITGGSGAGKSSLLAALRNRGAAFLTDDVAAVTIGKENTPWAHPGYPQQKLWKDSVGILGMDTGVLPAILPGRDKYAIAAKEDFCRTPALLAAICELRPENRPDVDMIRLAGPDKIAMLLRHTYRNNLVAGLGLKTEHFELCATVAKQVIVCRLLRPSDTFSLTEQAQLVEDLMNTLVSGQMT